MKLISEIIDLLSSSERDVATALMKTKVLLFQLGEKELLEWVNNELNGYPDRNNLPSYRLLYLTVVANISNGSYRATEQPLPLSHLESKLRDRLEKDYNTQSIAVIEGYAKKDTGLQVPVPPEFYPSLSKGLANRYEVERAWALHSVGAMTQIVTEVSSRLLDFVLELSERFPEEMNPTEMKSRSKEVGVSDLFNSAVFGDNTTIVVGNSNTQNVKNSVVKNDLPSLKLALKEIDVSESDIEELEKAIESDQNAIELENKSFGENVSQWVGGMVTKAANTAWNVNVGAAGSLLATAIGKYYGF